MHETAFENAQKFVQKYNARHKKVLDVGSYDVNGTLKPLFANYTGMDIEAGKNVDVISELGQPFPFKDKSFDVVVSSSCLEHDPAFWVTVKEMMRVSKELIGDDYKNYKR